MFSPSSASEIVSGSEDKTLIVWDATGGSKKLTLKGHESIVSSVAYSPDGHEIVSGSRGDDNAAAAVRVWDAKSGCVLFEFKGHEDDDDKDGRSDDSRAVVGRYFGISAVAFSPDGTEIVSGSADKRVRSWPYSYFRNFSPDALEATYFLPELHDAHTATDFDWSTSWTFALFRRSPRSLLSTTNAKGWNLVHAAAAVGNSSFLECVLRRPPPPGSDEEEADDPKRQAVALAACLMVDNFGFTPLHYAVESKDSESMSLILECIVKGVCASPVHNTVSDKRKRDQVRQHPGDIFPLRDLIDLMWGFPAVFLKHVDNMTLVSNYSAIVGGTKADIDEDTDIVLGSLHRSPDHFWREQYDEEGITAAPKLVPFKGLAGSANDFLAAAVYVAQTTNRYSFFMSPIMLALIDFKWNSHVEKLFMKVPFLLMLLL